MIIKENATIERIIVHKVLKKENDSEHGFSQNSNELFAFRDPEMDTLKSRILAAFNKNKRFFKLEIEDSSENSFYDNANQLKDCSESEFILISKKISELLAISHNSKTIPGGLLLIMDGYFNKSYFVLVIKAELQEAFKIDGNIIELVDELFLSPAKDFYKIGYIIEDLNENLDFNSIQINSKFSTYMYDDNFSSGKRNLAEYFYKTFLGFTTNRNDKLITKNFHEDICSLIERNVKGYEHKKGLKNALNSLYREDITGVINPNEFVNQIFPVSLKELYDKELANKYPTSFNKDLSLVENRLLRGHIKLLGELKIEGPANTIENNVTVLNGKHLDLNKLVMEIESGKINQIITIKTD